MQTLNCPMKAVEIKDVRNREGKHVLTTWSCKHVTLCKCLCNLTQVKLLLTCCGDQKNNRRGLDLETEYLAAVALTGWAPMASVSNFEEGSVERSKDDILPSPETVEMTLMRTKAPDNFLNMHSKERGFFLFLICAKAQM